MKGSAKKYIWDTLCNKLWHTTSVERYESITRMGCISINPPIPDSERYNTNGGEEHCPLVRYLGGVSLFDFTNFNYKTYPKEYPSSSVYNFVPCPPERDKAIWIEINRELISHNYIDAEQLLAKWKNEKLHGHNIMPMIEAAHIGSIFSGCFVQVLIYQRQTNLFTLV